MTELRPKDVSLYELALSCEPDAHPLQVSPTIFKSIVGTVFDFLVEENISATLWMKLPRGPLWQADVDRFCRSVQSPCSVYQLQNSQAIAAAGSPMPIISSLSLDSVEIPASGRLSTLRLGEPDAEMEDQATGSPLPLIAGTEPIAEFAEFMMAESAVSQCTHVVVPLATETQLRREYFLLMQSPGLRLLILAHRPRSVRSPVVDEPARMVSTSSMRSGALAQDSGEDSQRKHPLLSFCSFEPTTIAQVLYGIHRAISLAQMQNGECADIDSLLMNWEQIVEHPETTLNPRLVSQLFIRQVQRQEDIWHSSTAHRRQAELAAELQLDNEELLNAIRLKDEFLQNVGQQLRTPLTTMKTALTLLNSPNLKPPQRQRYMDLLTKECDRQSSLITSVLDLIQLENAVENTAIQPLRLVDVVPAVVSTYQPLAQEKGVMVAYTIPGTLPAVACASPWLRQIVINLLHNGIKFTPEGGKVWVVATQQGDYVQIEFKDTGIGISTGDLPKIFERFYRVRQAGEDDSGAGLGLSIVQQLLLHSGGSISVKSKPGEGSTFNVLLPIYR